MKYPTIQQLKNKKSEIRDLEKEVNLNHNLSNYVKKYCCHPEAQNPAPKLICKTCAIQWAIKLRNEALAESRGKK